MADRRRARRLQTAVRALLPVIAELPPAQDEGPLRDDHGLAA